MNRPFSLHSGGRLITRHQLWRTAAASRLRPTRRPEETTMTRQRPRPLSDLSDQVKGPPHMKTKLVIAAALAAVFAVTAAAPSFAAGDPAKHQKRIHRMIHRADTNGDGRVSRAEMEAALGTSFAVLDTNHDGVLSKSELDNRRQTYKAYRQHLK